MVIWLLNYMSIPIWNHFIRDKKLFISIICMQMFLLLALFNPSLRVDYIGYFEGYNEISTYSLGEMLGKINIFGYPQIETLKCESGWMILNWLVAKIGLDFYGFLLLHGLFCISAVGVFVYRYSEKPWLSLALFIALGFYKYTFGILRQFMALCLFLYAIPYVKERKVGKFMLIIAINFLIHRSSLIYVVLYFISKIKINKKIYVGYYVLALLVLLMSPHIIDNVIVPLLKLANYASYVPKQWELNFLVLIIYALPVMIFATVDFDTFFESKINNIFCWGFLLTLPIQAMSTIHDMFGRLAFDYYVFIIMLLPADLAAYRYEKIAKIGTVAVYVLGGMFYVYTMIGTQYVPYSIIWS